jgi:cyanate permease
VVSAEWFAPEERVLATTIASLANFLGIGMGYMLPLAGLQTALIVEAAFATLTFIGFLALARKHPPTPSSPSSEQSKMAFWESCKAMVKDPLLMGIIITTGSNIGVSFCIIELLGQLMENIGVGVLESAVVGLCFIISGTVGGLVATFFVEKLHTFVWPLRVLLIISAAGMFPLIWANSYGMYIAFFTIGGFGIIGFVPLAIEASIE